MRPEHVVMGLTALVSLATLVRMIRGTGSKAGVEETQLREVVEGFKALRDEIKTMSHTRLLPLEKDMAVLKASFAAHIEDTRRRFEAIEAHPARGSHR